MKTHPQDLSGTALDFAVAKAEGYIDDPSSWLYQATLPQVAEGSYKPSTNAAQGHLLIEREGIALRRHSNGTWYAMLSADLGNGERAGWHESTYRNGERYGPHSYQVRSRRQRFDGPTPIIAAMRCFVAHKLGGEVEIPDTLP